MHKAAPMSSQGPKWDRSEAHKLVQFDPEHCPNAGITQLRSITVVKMLVSLDRDLSIMIE